MASIIVYACNFIDKFSKTNLHYSVINLIPNCLVEQGCISALFKDIGFPLREFVFFIIDIRNYNITY